MKQLKTKKVTIRKDSSRKNVKGGILSLNEKELDLLGVSEYNKNINVIYDTDRVILEKKLKGFSLDMEIKRGFQKIKIEQNLLDYLLPGDIVKGEVICSYCGKKVMYFEEEFHKGITKEEIKNIMKKRLFHYDMLFCSHCGRNL